MQAPSSSSYKVTGPEITHVRAETEFWEDKASPYIFHKIFLERKVELTSFEHREG